MKKLLPLLVAGSLVLSSPVMHTPAASAFPGGAAVRILKLFWRATVWTTPKVVRRSYKIVKRSGQFATGFVTTISTANGAYGVYINCKHRKAGPELNKLEFEQQVNLVRDVCRGRHK